MIKTQIGKRYEMTMLGSCQPRALPSWTQSEAYDSALPGLHDRSVISELPPFCESALYCAGSTCTLPSTKVY